MRGRGKFPVLIEFLERIAIELWNGGAINPLVEGYARFGSLSGREVAFFGD